MPTSHLKGRRRLGSDENNHFKPDIDSNTCKPGYDHCINPNTLCFGASRATQRMNTFRNARNNAPGAAAARSFRFGWATP